MIEVIWKWIVEHWELCARVVLVIIALILALVRKKPVKVLDTIKESILRVLPKFIVAAENQYANYNGENKGQRKKDCALQLVKEFLLTTIGIDELALPDLLAFAADALEDILATPAKKGK